MTEELPKNVARLVSCPGCGKLTAWQSAHRPFCSERCRDMDLGAWAQERYRIETREQPEEPVDPSQQN